MFKNLTPAAKFVAAARQLHVSPSTAATVYVKHKDAIQNQLAEAESLQNAVSLAKPLLESTVVEKQLAAPAVSRKVDVAKSTPRQFLQYLLQQGPSCTFPSQMTAYEREHPYRSFAPLRPYYLQYALTKELPARGFEPGCHTLQLTEKLQLDSQGLVKPNVKEAQRHFLPEFDKQLSKIIQKRLQGQTQCRYVALPIFLRPYVQGDDVFPGHAMMVIIDLKAQTVEYFEPNGPNAEWAQLVSSVLKKLFKRSVLSQFTYVPPEQLCPQIGSQPVQEGAYCAHYSLLYAWLRVACADCSRSQITEDFLRYTPTERLFIVRAFTCHMWLSMEAAGLLGKRPDGRGRLVGRQQLLDYLEQRDRQQSEAEVAKLRDKYQRQQEKAWRLLETSKIKW